MSDDICVKAWVHTCEQRMGSECLERTLQSIRESDIGDDYEVCVNRPYDGASRYSLEGIAFMDAWWKDTLLRKAEEASEGGRRGYVLRLEDDVIVNRHILHNIQTWPALDELRFGLGDLFNYDGCWPKFCDLTRLRPVRSDVVRRIDLNTVGSQGHLFSAAALPAIMAKVKRAFEYWGCRGFVNYDLVPPRACAYAGYGFYAHVPALVDCHDLCTASAWAGPHEAHRSANFSLDWKREVG